MSINLPIYEQNYHKSYETNTYHDSDHAGINQIIFVSNSGSF